MITLSAGNAGQAYAWAGRSAGVAVTVVMPAGAVRSKVDACLGYGARVVLHGAHVGETFAEMERLRDAEGLEFVHPFDDPAVIAGHGSIGLEMLEDVPDLDVVVVGVGGGGLISGVAAALKERRPGIRVYGVEPELSNAMSLALAANEVVRIQPESVADGLGAPFAGAWTLAMCRRYLDDIVLLDDPTILAGMRFAVERLEAGPRTRRSRGAGRRPRRTYPDPGRGAGRGRDVGRQRGDRPARGTARCCGDAARRRGVTDDAARPATEPLARVAPLGTPSTPGPSRSKARARLHRGQLRPAEPVDRRDAPSVFLHRARDPRHGRSFRPGELGSRGRRAPQ